MEKYQKYILFVAGGILLISIAYLAGSRVPSARGAAPSGLPAGTTTQSTVIASTTAGFFTKPNSVCSSRVISTASSSIMITFGSTTPTGINGHWQGASTTVAYDSGLYGCGMWSIWGTSLGSIVTVTEIR